MTTATKMVKAFKEHRYETTKAAELADDYGIRLRQTKKTRHLGAQVWELATSYYYTSQNSTLARLADLTHFAVAHGLEVTPLAWQNGAYRATDKATKDHLRFETKPWPKDSWAILYVEISEAPAHPTRSWCIEVQQAIAHSLAQALRETGFNAGAEIDGADGYVFVDTAIFGDAADFQRYIWDLDGGRYGMNAVDVYALDFDDIAADLEPPPGCTPEEIEAWEQIQREQFPPED